MKRKFVSKALFGATLFLFLGLFSCCKSNKDAYNSAYKKLKEKNDEIQLAERAKTASDVSKEITMHYTDTTAVHPPESVTLLVGEPINFKEYSIVAKTFINRTNARSFQKRMEEEGYPAILVQNDELVFRIILISFDSEAEARDRLVSVRKVFPDAWILRRK